MASTDGGEIYLGIEQLANGRLQTTSVSSWRRVRQQSFELASNKQTISISLLKGSEVDPVIVEKDVVLRVSVSRSFPPQRPVFLGENPFRVSYIRRPQATSIWMRNRSSACLRSRPSKRGTAGSQHFSIDDLDQDSIASYRSGFVARDPFHPFCVRAFRSSCAC